MNKWWIKKTFRAVVAKMPMIFHRLMTREKIRQLSKHLMTEKDLKICEKDFSRRDAIVEKYMLKYPKAEKLFERKLEDLLKHNPLLRQVTDLESVKKDIRFCWYGYGFHPDEYMFFDLGGVNKASEKRRTFVSEQERVCFRFSVNDFSDSLLSDKADAFNRLRTYYKRNALVIDRKTSFEEFERFVKGKKEFVEKFVSSSRGQAVKLIIVSEIQKKDYFKKLKKQGRFLLEDRMIQSAVLDQWSTSLNNIRISTFRTGEGTIPVCGFFTMGRKGTFVVNATIGCVFAAIDVKTGLICSEGCDELGNRYVTHPDNGLVIEGFQLPEWNHAIALCIEIADQLDNFAYVSFDLAHTVKGWDVVEINPSGQFLHQAGTLEGFRQELIKLTADMEQLAPYDLKRRK